MPSCTHDDDELGLLITVLLLAAKQRHNEYNKYGSCNNGQNSRKVIPIPYPIPFTNSPIIFRPQSDEPTVDDSPHDNKLSSNINNTYNDKSNYIEENSTNFNITYKPILINVSDENTS